MKGRINKLLVSVLSIGALACSGFAIKTQVDIVKADEAAEHEAYCQSLVTTLTMEEGAAVRLGATDAQKGIRFLTKMTNTDYTNLMAEVGTEEDKYYSEVSFGMVIVPRTYLTTGFELTEENVFGSNPKFDATITANTATQRMIIDMLSPDLYDYDTTDTDTDYYFNGAIVGIKSENTAVEFVGRGYIKYKLNADNATYQYKFASYYGDDISNNSRSMAYVAQKALEDDEYKNDTTTQTYLNGYLSKVEGVVDSSYTVKYHFLDEVSGEYVENTDLEETVAAKIGDTVDLSSTATYAVNGYIPDTEKNAQTEYTVYANNRLVIDRYYKMFTPYSASPNTEITKVTEGDDAGSYAVSTTDGWQKRAMTFVSNGSSMESLLDMENANYISLKIKFTEAMANGRIALFADASGNDTNVAAENGSVFWYIGADKSGNGVRAKDGAELFTVFDANGTVVTSLVTGEWYEFIIPVLQVDKDALSGTLGIYYQHMAIYANGSLSAATTLAYFKDVRLLQAKPGDSFSLTQTEYELRSFQSAEILFEGTSSIDDLTFTSANETVAKVVDGKIVAQGTSAAGKSTTITVSDGITSREIAVTVKSDVTTHASYGSTVEYVSDGDFAGSYKYINATGGSTGYIDATGGTTKNHGEGGVYFDGVANTGHRPETEFFENYKYLKLDFYMSSNVSAVVMRRSVYNTSGTGLFTNLEFKPNTYASANGTDYYLLNASGAKVTQIVKDTWYTLYVPMDKGENSIDYNKWSMVSLYTNASAVVTADKANAPVLYLKNISFEEDVAATVVSETTDYNAYSYKWNAQKVVEDGEAAYKITTNDGWAGKAMIFADSAYDSSLLTSGKTHISMKVKLGNNVNGISLTGYDGSTRKPYDTATEFWEPGKENTNASSSYIAVYDADGNSVTKLEVGVWYNFVITIPDATTIQNYGLYLYVRTGSNDKAGEIWYKDVELCTSDPYVSNFVYAPTAATISTETTASYATYYFDPVSGNDENSGESESSPLSSLSRAKELISTATDNNPIKILFKAGSVYNEPFEISGFVASQDKPLIIGVYGETLSQKYVSFTCNGTDSYACVKITAGNVRISGFECYSVNGRYGILVSPVAAGAMSNIVIENCYIHDVNFDTTGITLPTDGSAPDEATAQQICSDANYAHSYGGIVFTASTSASVGASWFENVWIQNNLIERVSRTGIWISSSWVQRPGLDWGYNHYYDDNTNWYPQRNINVIGNRVEYAGGDGIVLVATVGGYIESNVCYHAQYLGRTGYWNAGIWTHSCDNVVVQFNEAAYTHGTNDGQGFDIDIGCTNITFRYNYSHHNEGGGLLLCNNSTTIVKYDENGNAVLDDEGNEVTEFLCPAWGNNVIANNIFVDNGSYLIKINGYCQSFIFANNTCIFSESGTLISPFYIVHTDAKNTTDSNGDYITGDNWQFINNIFYTRNEIYATFRTDFCTSVTFDHNAFYNFSRITFEELFHTAETTTKTNNIEDVDPGFANIEAVAGYENSYIFVPNETLLTGAVWIEGLTDCDYRGRACDNDTYYYGAFLG